jgi:diguanylate cyclase (GGDEF)-like protein/PAS domain S-box-containing protein
MSHNLLLILADPAEGIAVRNLLAAARDGPHHIESVSRWGEALDRLSGQGGKGFAAIIVDLFLPDCQGIETFEKVFHASPYTPILIFSRVRDEATARLAVQRGAHDYLLAERLDEHVLSKALSSTFARATYAAALSFERERAEVTLNSIGDAVISTDLAGNITYLNPMAASMTGWSLPDAYGRPLEEVLRIIDSDSRESAMNPLALAIHQNKTVGLSANCVLIRRDGHESAIEDTAAPIHDRRGQVIGAVIVFHDVGAARAMSLRMSYLAQHDFLTELPNRMLLSDRLKQAITFARRHVTSLAVLFIDVDHFKRVNDTYGHPIGDELLKSIAQRLTACVRSSDTVSRQGGDEFLVLLTEVARADDAALSAQKILEALSASHRIAHRDVHVTVSIGIGVYPDDGTDAQTLLKNADAALFQAKALGRRQHQFCTPPKRSAPRGTELREAVSQK